MGQVTDEQGITETNIAAMRQVVAGYGFGSESFLPFFDALVARVESLEEERDGWKDTAHAAQEQALAFNKVIADFRARVVSLTEANAARDTALREIGFATMHCTHGAKVRRILARAALSGGEESSFTRDALKSVLRGGTEKYGEGTHAILAAEVGEAPKVTIDDDFNALSKVCDLLASERDDLRARVVSLTEAASVFLSVVTLEHRGEYENHPAERMLRAALADVGEGTPERPAGWKGDPDWQERVAIAKREHKRGIAGHTDPTPPTCPTCGMSADFYRPKVDRCPDPWHTDPTGTTSP
jgi:hypothetical protein